MLEVLTESGDTQEARERVATILDEQKKTLRFAMSRPQVHRGGYIRNKHLYCFSLS